MTAAGFIARKGRTILDTLCAAFTNLDSDIDPHEITEERRLSEHQRIYRKIVAKVFDPRNCRPVADGPAFQALLAHPPDGQFARLAGTAATLAYEAELHIGGSPNFSWAEKLGVTTSLVDARQAANDGRLVNLICEAAVIPAVLGWPKWGDKAVIEGGMADQNPFPEPDRGHSMNLPTRYYDKLPGVPNRDYICPSIETEADKIDVTDPAKLICTWDQGIAEGKKFLDDTDNLKTKKER